MTTLFWFRRDLRLADNPALGEAVRQGDGSVAPLFVIDPQLLASVGPARSAYLRDTLSALNESLGGQLIIRVGEPEVVLRELCRELGAREIYATGDFAPTGRARDERVARGLAQDGVALRFLDSPYVVVPGTVLTKAQTPSKVFTPFRRYWELEPLPEPYPAPSGVTWVGGASESLDAISQYAARQRPDYFGDLPDDVPHYDPRVGEAGALATLEQFMAHVEQYDAQRNTPGVEGTSRLSPHLRFGTIHPRTVLARTNGPSRGAEVFRSEIAWREFYADVLWHNPASTSQALQTSMADLRVDSDARAVDRFQAWARGETGYPLVDAGMRQLLSEGWMHNRVRMLTASFLIKHLHIDWRWGAKWFMWRLIDGDVASNQHGWQWTAGTGTDASPYYRVFNPNVQAERFDPDGVFIRRYVSELRDTPPPDCLAPGGGGGLFTSSGYPPPIIDAAAERDEALARLAQLRER